MMTLNPFESHFALQLCVLNEELEAKTEKLFRIVSQSPASLGDSLF